MSDIFLFFCIVGKFPDRSVCKWAWRVESMDERMEWMDGINIM